jgi:4-hydroxyphenylpyruvate dioxygenase
LDGSTESKLSAAKAASFGQVELWRQDVEAAGGDTQAIVATLKRLGLGLTDYQVLLDFDGAPDAIRDAKRALDDRNGALCAGRGTCRIPAFVGETARAVGDSLPIMRARIVAMQGSLVP